MKYLGKFLETESRLKVTRGWEERGMGSYWLMGTEILFGVMRKFVDSGDDCTALWMSVILLSYPLKTGKFCFIYIFYHRK